jgi:hypothetical protein
MIRGFITGFNDGFVYIEQPDRKVAKISLATIPGFCRKGDFIIQERDADKFRIDFAITQERHQEIRRMSETFFD